MARGFGSLADEKRGALAIAELVHAPNIVTRCADVAEHEVVELTQHVKATFDEPTHHRERTNAWGYGSPLRYFG